MKSYLDLVELSLPKQHFDCLGFSIIDFKKKSHNSFQLSPYGEAPLYFDLASLTKPLTLATSYLRKPSDFDEKMLLLLNHCGSLPSGGRLGKDYEEQLWSYEIKEAPTLYSDYSSLRLMLELEKKWGKGLKEVVSHYFDSELLFWKDLPTNASCPETGFRDGKSIQGAVHDDNAFYLNRFCSHAGLFSTIDGISKTLLNLDAELNLLVEMEGDKQTNGKQQFIKGWDTISHPETTLAGPGAPEDCFGFLGFTGTSVWISPKKKKGFVLLTNGTQKYWKERSELNQLRRELGGMVWRSQ